MFTALKKLVSHNEVQGNATPPGMQAMAQSLQKKFAKGCHYNMKILLKGDRNVGKTCLFYRLQGHKFKEEYIPTQEIQVASIHWNYKATDDIVKVEVWDVVDKGKKKKRIEGLKLDNNIPDIIEEPALDAEFVDVYKNTNGVILLMDITKQWTFDYVQKELPKIPPNIPVLVFANHRDMGHHRCVTVDDIHFFIESLERGADFAPVRFTEGSMRNGFGLKYVHKFFNLPFLQLQRETLLKQLETNANETKSTSDELDLLEDSEEQNYDIFLEYLSNKRRQIAENSSPAYQHIEQSDRQTKIPHSHSIHSCENVSNTPLDKEIPHQSKSIPSTPVLSQISNILIPGPPTVGSFPTTNTHNQGTLPPSSEHKSGNFMSRLFGKQSTTLAGKDLTITNDQINEVLSIGVGPPDRSVKSVEDFVPDEGLDKSFLDDDKPDKISCEIPAETVSDSDDELNGNPMVADYQDDVDSEDSVPSIHSLTFKKVTSEVVQGKDYSNGVTSNAATASFSLAESDSDVVQEKEKSETATKIHIREDGTDDEDNKIHVINEISEPVANYLYTLDDEDLSIFENGIATTEIKSSTEPSRPPVNNEIGSHSIITKKSKSKDKNKDEEKSHKKKHKKHKSKNRDQDKPEADSSDKKMRSKKKVVDQTEQWNNELEDFLSGETQSVSGKDYEKL